MLKDSDFFELLDNLYDGVYYVDQERKITFWNKAAEEITGFHRAEVLGTSCADNILCHVDASGHMLCSDGCPLFHTLRDGEKRETALFLHHKTGHRVPVHIRVSPIFNESGEISGAVEVFSDKSRDQEAYRQLEVIRKQNIIDPLMGIGNRRYAEKMFETHLYQLRTLDVPFAVAMIDLDGFKAINDCHGHNVGDQVLQMTARSLQNVLRAKDSIIRWGGDEIVLFLPGISTGGLKEVLERVRVIIENSFIMIENEKLALTASIGATFMNKGDRLEVVIDRVDKLMYQSKKNGGDRLTVG